ncbi:hypothetical protein EAO70_05790 [Streptomyces sp. adm13(2018)]|uniref:DUF6221 family protein n=1 Tax=Streptomyces sp. adm13(2018) TaxID=2479007 RepID=UPI0011CDA16A|nr:DUF6221 family protein [Streptomyces sp. adm13(2018)]TXS22373.1 hypothetical protein EAO70_05790 [Streptomyces sp. adm13(2018)]
MDDLIAFLRARLDEDTRGLGDAQSISGMRWVVGTMQGTTVLMSASRFRAELDAKRQIIALCEPPLVDVRGLGDNEPRFIPGEGAPWGIDVLRVLALAYAGHPDYQDAWRP